MKFVSKQFGHKVILAAAFCILTTLSMAETVYAPTDDAEVQNTLSSPPLLVISDTSDLLITGCAGSVGKERCTVIPIQLPDFGAVSNPFSEASFIFNYAEKNGTVQGNVDLYGLGRRASPTPLTNDYWTATSNVDPTDATLIAQDVITVDSTLYGLRTVSNSGLVDYLNAQYADGAGAGEYVFFRLSTDAAQTGAASRYLITSADAGTAETAPHLVFPTVMTGAAGDAEVQLTLSSPPYAILSETADSLILGSAGGLVGGEAKERCIVMPFLLPDLGAVSTPFTNATFVFNYSNKYNTVQGNVDVYGLGRRAAPDVLTNDYWTATATMDPTDATFIAQDVIPANSTFYGLQTVTNSALVDYLNTQYANGAGAGEYVFLRLSTDAPQTGGVNRYYITSTEGATDETMPRIVYNGEFTVELTSDRPFIWATMEERDGILDKIANYSWASDQKDALIARVQSNLSSYLADRDAYLRALPIDWSLSSPQFYTTVDQVNTAWRTKLDMAQDCSVIYYLTRDTRYAQLAADVLHNSVRWLLETPKSSNTAIGGWTFHDVEWLYESRSIGSQMPIIYDFVHAYLLNNTVYDVHEGTEKNFSFTDAQSVFTQMRNLTRDRGYPDTNWCSLMGDSMILNTLAIDDEVTRNTFVDEFLHTDFARQDSIQKQENHFDGPAPYSCYPESLGYSKGVVERDSYYVSLLDRYDPGQNYPAEFPKLIQSLHRTKQMHYPENAYQVQFGDGHRLTSGAINYMLADILYSQAKAQGRTDLMAINGGLLAEGIATGKYRRNVLQAPDSLGVRNQVLPLLWGTPEINETPETLDLFRTDTLPYAGLALQRNFSPNGNDNDGLMCFVQGAAFVHSHASGMNMELYGCGKVLGVKGYGRDFYARSFASANTVIVNGYSRGVGGWGGIAINTVQVEAMEPATRAAAVSSNLSFSCTSFLDNKGDGAEATQERTMAVIRTSPTTGFYFDLFRSDSSLSGEYHDYLYHNIGDSLTVTDSAGTPLSFTSQPDRFVNDPTDPENQPGWGYWLDPKATGTVTDSVKAQFATPFSGQPTIYMNMHIPGDSAREYATAMGPSDGEHPSPYNTKNIPTLIVRRTGQAWNNPFCAVFEPHQDGADGGTVQHVTTLKNGTKVVGMKVESIVDGKEVSHYIIANTSATDTYEDASVGLSFTGRFGIAADFGNGDYEIYIGEGSSMAFRDYTVSSTGGDTQASLICRNGQQPVLTANGSVDVTKRPDPTVITMVALGTAVNLTDGTTWSDGQPAHYGDHYVIPDTGNLRGETGTSTFPGLSLTVEAGGKFQVRSIDSAGEVTRVDNLILEGGTGGNFALLAAGTGTDATNVLNGTITQSGASQLLTYGSSINRSLKILSQINGDGTLQVTGAGAVIDNAANTFSGTWQVDTGATLTFNSAESVGSAGIEVLGGGTLTISGDWSTDTTLTVADAAFTQVDFGTNTWLVSSLVFDGSAVANGRYTASELNALGANAVFSGSGTLIVSFGGAVSDTLYSGAADAGVKEDGSIENLTSATSQVGTGGSNPWVDRAVVYVFQLPDLGMVDSPFLSSSFSFNVTLNESAKNTDLYGLGKRSASTVLGSDYYGQTATADPTDATLIQSDILVGSTALGIITAENSTLTDYLNAQYDGGNGIGHYVFLRLNSATAKAGINRATLTMSEGGVAGPPDTHPQLAYTAISYSEPPPPPMMVINQTEGNFTFSWSNSTYKLQYSTNLMDGTWTDYEGGTSSPVSVTPTNTAFFRLIEQ